MQVIKECAKFFSMWGINLPSVIFQKEATEDRFYNYFCLFLSHQGGIVSLNEI